MRYAIAILTVAAWVTPVARAIEPEPAVVQIPLKDVWAYNMPGTHELTDNRAGDDNHYVAREGPLVAEIRRALPYVRHDKGERPKYGFAVLGTGMDALERAHAVLVESQKPRKSFPSGRIISIVFFSHMSGAHVHLDSVERRGPVVEIRYHFVPRLTRNATECFALIAVNDLPPGRVEVKLTQLPMDNRYAGRKPTLPPNSEWEQWLICRPFSFEVEK